MSKPKPIDEVRIGSIKAAIWKNQTNPGSNPRNGGARFNVTFQRLYRDGDEWKSANSFGRDDLLRLAKLADRVHSRIYELQRDQ